MTVVNYYTNALQFIKRILGKTMQLRPYMSNVMLK